MRGEFARNRIKTQMNCTIKVQPTLQNEGHLKENKPKLNETQPCASNTKTHKHVDVRQRDETNPFVERRSFRQAGVCSWRAVLPPLHLKKKQKKNHTTKTPLDYTQGRVSADCQVPRRPSPTPPPTTRIWSHQPPKQDTHKQREKWCVDITWHTHSHNVQKFVVSDSFLRCAAYSSVDAVSTDCILRLLIVDIGVLRRVGKWLVGCNSFLRWLPGVGTNVCLVKV